MSDPFLNIDTETHTRREKAAARELRRSRWWQNRIAQGRCNYCQMAVNAETATMDHVVPVSRGGRSTPGNVVVACKPCNTAKKTQLIMEWQSGPY